MKCVVVFEKIKGANGEYEICKLDFGNGAVVTLRDYNAVDKIRLIKSLIGG